MPTDDKKPYSFDPNEHLLHLKSSQGEKDYLPVAWRIVWFRHACPQGTIDTEELEYDTQREVEVEVNAWNAEKRKSEKILKKARGYARYRAVVTDGKGGRGTGTKSENAANFPDFGEKAETGSIGRALATLGYGTQFTGEDFYEGERLADSPIERTSETPPSPNEPLPIMRPSPAQSNGSQSNGASKSVSSAEKSPPSAEKSPPMVTEQQLASLRKLCQLLGKNPDALGDLTYEQAKDEITKLSALYRESRNGAQKASLSAPPLPPQKGTSEPIAKKGDVLIKMTKEELQSFGEFSGLVPDESKWNEDQLILAVEKLGEWGSQSILKEQSEQLYALANAFGPQMSIFVNHWYGETRIDKLTRGQAYKIGVMVRQAKLLHAFAIVGEGDIDYKHLHASFTTPVKSIFTTPLYFFQQLEGELSQKRQEKELEDYKYFLAQHTKEEKLLNTNGSRSVFLDMKNRLLGTSAH